MVHRNPTNRCAMIWHINLCALCTCYYRMLQDKTTVLIYFDSLDDDLIYLSICLMIYDFKLLLIVLHVICLGPLYAVLLGFCTHSYFVLLSSPWMGGWGSDTALRYDGVHGRSRLAWVITYPGRWNGLDHGRTCDFHIMICCIFYYRYN